MGNFRKERANSYPSPKSDKRSPSVLALVVFGRLYLYLYADLHHYSKVVPVMDKKLFIVSTRTIDTTLIAGWRNGSLRVQQVKTYKDLNDKDVQKIRGQMKLYRTKGFTAVANEPIARFAGDGIMSISLTDKDSNNIPRLTSALTAFKQLSKRGGISYAEGAKPIMVPETVYNETVNERG